MRSGRHLSVLLVSALVGLAGCEQAAVGRCALRACEPWPCGEPEPACPCSSLCETAPCDEALGPCVGQACSDVPVFAYDPEAGRCARFETDCEVPEGTEFFTSEASCEAEDRCGAALPCAAGLACELASCEAETGTCAPVPGDCVRSGGPEGAGAVCGCDAVTYWSDCERILAGVAIAYQGACL